MEVRGNTIATVIRRVGGLEETAGLRFGSRNVIRRVGGLEEHPRHAGRGLNVIRRVGG